MAEISTLLEIFQDGKSAADLAVSLRSDSARPGLERFVSILEAGIGGCRSWTRPQIDAVVAVAKLIVAATRSTSAVHVDPVMLLSLRRRWSSVSEIWRNSCWMMEISACRTQVLALLEKDNTFHDPEGTSTNEAKMEGLEGNEEE